MLSFRLYVLCLRRENIREMRGLRMRFGIDAGGVRMAENGTEENVKRA